MGRGSYLLSLPGKSIGKFVNWKHITERVGLQPEGQIGE
jgi:hypothetical protein